MNILVTNDDGVYAPGIRALAQALLPLGCVTIVAPEVECSGASSMLTLDRPLTPVQVEEGVWAVNGSPADCVFLALNGLFDLPFDLVVSGINRGENMGDDVLYSGTIGAAFEGRGMHHTPLAISLAGHNVKTYTHIDDYTVAATWVYNYIKEGLPSLPPRHVLNINIPDGVEIVGCQYTRMGVRGASSTIIVDANPRGKKVYWIGLSGKAVDDRLEVVPHQNVMTDFDAIKAGYVSVTPLQLDATSYHALEVLRRY